MNASPRHQEVDSLTTIFNSPFEGRQNQYTHKRELKGHFNLLAWRLLFVKPTQRESKLQGYASDRGIRGYLFGQAAKQVLADVQVMKENGMIPEVRVANSSFYSGRVKAFHLDITPKRVIFFYTDPGVESIDNEDAVPHPAYPGPAVVDAREGAAIQKNHAGDVVAMRGTPGTDPSCFDREARYHRAPTIGVLSQPRLMVLNG